MTFLRRYLRAAAVIWLSCQVASLSALGPANCCVAHRQAAEAEQDCHQANEDSCPMHAATGKACPAHAVAGAGNPDDGGNANQQHCVMRGTCDGPALALSSLFSVNGILAEGVHVPFDAISSPLSASARWSTPLVESHDTPPPRR
jgi:hypothetical protein